MAVIENLAEVITVKFGITETIKVDIEGHGNFLLACYRELRFLIKKLH